MDIKQGVALGAMFTLFIAPWFIAGLAYWGWTFSAIGLVILISEVISTIRKKKTISQQFWDYYAVNKTGGLIIIGCLIASVTILVLHLLHIV